MGNPQLNSRNRYYESGSGGEEEEEQVNEDPFNNILDSQPEDNDNDIN